MCNLHRNSNPEPALIGLCYVYIYIYNSRERKFLNYVNGGDASEFLSQHFEKLIYLSNN